MFSPAPAPPRIGLVLGAGGSTGAAFHAGTLLALEHDLGWDPRTADVIVGSSAGSIIASLLRAGVSSDDLAAWGAEAVPSSAGETSRRVLEAFEHEGYHMTPRPRWQPPGPGLLRRLANPLNAGLGAAAMSMMPHGWIDAGTSLRRLGDLIDGWPERSLWINAVRTSDGRRVVFGRDAHAPLGEAIAASCAIPMLFRPVKIESRYYIDGGAHSPTNADLLVDSGVDIAIVSSPMSARSPDAGRRPDTPVRALLARRLRRECAKLERAGIEVRVFEPGRTTLGAMGFNALDRRRSVRVVREAFLDAGEQIAADATLGAQLRCGRRHRASDAAGRLDT
jgi:NTE family protein